MTVNFWMKSINGHLLKLSVMIVFVSGIDLEALQAIKM